jgi:hypothetical protein
MLPVLGEPPFLKSLIDVLEIISDGSIVPNL